MNQKKTFAVEVAPKNEPMLGFQVLANSKEDAKLLAIQAVKSWGWKPPYKLCDIWEVENDGQ